MVGRIVRPHGLLGEVSVEILTDFPERFAEGVSLALGPDGGRRLRIASARPHGGRFLIRFDGVDLEEAERLRGVDLCVTPSEAPPRPEGYVFHYELQGCRVVTGEGEELGTVTDLQDVGGRPLLSVATPRGERSIPFTRPIVVEVDLASRRVVVAPPVGLLE